MTMFSQDNLFKARARSILLCLLMVLSTTAALATTASASQARTYTTNRDPHDVAIGDFNCDNHNDIAIATDGTLRVGRAQARALKRGFAREANRAIIHAINSK